MQIELQKLGKRYRFEWVFRGLDYNFLPQSSYALVGHNGSGKSTLLQILSGYLSPSIGKIRFSLHGQAIEIGDVYRHISLCTPYLELPEELSLEEAIRFHSQFKPFKNNLSIPGLLDILSLPNSARRKEIRFFSSGMKQRLKLALAFMSDTSVLLLDEPSITLDSKGLLWYRQLLQEEALGQRLCIIASNISADFEGCEHTLDILNYK